MKSLPFAKVEQKQYNKEVKNKLKMKKSRETVSCKKRWTKAKRKGGKNVGAGANCEKGGKEVYSKVKQVEQMAQKSRKNVKQKVESG